MASAPQDSPNIGACLCLGCWLEGGKELMGADVFEAIDWFGGNNPMGQNKLFKVVSATFLLPLPIVKPCTALIGVWSLPHSIFATCRTRCPPRGRSLCSTRAMRTWRRS